tara:strand:+ start:202 stop:606 length:405 start_codon:yes stop_codon:yes gene_type:complete
MASRRNKRKTMRKVKRRVKRTMKRTMKRLSNKAGDLHGVKKWFKKKLNKTKKKLKSRRRRTHRNKSGTRRSPVIGLPVLTPRSQVMMPTRRPRKGNMVRTVYSGIKSLDELKAKTMQGELKRLSKPPPVARKLD